MTTLERIRAAVGFTAPTVDPEEHAARVAAEVTRARRVALEQLCRQSTAEPGSVLDVLSARLRRQEHGR